MELPSAVSHHARRVLRLADGDALVLFDGKGSEFEAVLLAATENGSHSFAKIVRGGPVCRDAALQITLVQALVSQEKADWVVEKAVELGAHRILFAPCTRSVVRLDGRRLERRAERWREIAVAACGQCGRNTLPLVEAASDLETALRAGLDADERRVLEPTAEGGIGRVNGASVCMAVGPEGGFTSAELSLAHRLGYRGTRLGPRVVRTETAGLFAIAALLALNGELG